MPNVNKVKKILSTKSMKKKTEASKKTQRCQNPNCDALLPLEEWKNRRDAEPFICEHCGFPNVFDTPEQTPPKKKKEDLSDLLSRNWPLIKEWHHQPLHKIKREFLTDLLIADIKKISENLKRAPINTRKKFRDSDMWLVLGDICFRIRDLPNATLFYSQALLVDETNADIYCRLGEVALERNDFANAELNFHLALGVDINSARALNGYASIEFAHGKYYSALEKYKDVLNRYPKNLDALLGTALAYYMIKAYSNMEPYIRTIIEIDPNYPYVYELLGMQAYNNKYYALAESYYKKSLELDDYSWSTWNSLAALYIDLKNFEQARACLEKAAAIDQNQAKIWSNFGYLEYQLSRYQEAERHFQKATRLDPKEASAWNNLAALYHNVKKQYIDAEKCYKKALELSPDEKQIWQSYGNLLTSMGRTTEATQAYEKAGTAPTGCFIATAAFGTPMAAELDTLRAYRDTVLKSHWVGRAFIFVYYRISPAIAGIIQNYEGMKACVRAVLRKVVQRIKQKKNKSIQ
jgi:tetratricopeptide (TPR) repeat protein/predicted RNA-binding Zn-ribbon protein involved in translation (DUF1610 family)